MRTEAASSKSTRRRIRAFKLDVWPIRNEDDYDRATQVVEQLVLRGDLTEAQQARLDIFTTLIAAWDKEHYAIDTSDLTPIMLLKSLMADHGMTASDLGRLLGNRSLGSLILSEKRSLSKANIKKLAEHFCMNPSAFLR